MKTDLHAIDESLRGMIRAQVPAIRLRNDSPTGLEACGTKEVMQGRKKVDGFYFASVMAKPKDIRFYFFPIYTHPDAYADISPEVRKCLKGKSCFHIKKLSPEMEQEIGDMIAKGVELYQADDLI